MTLITQPHILVELTEEEEETLAQLWVSVGMTLITTHAFS